MVKTQKQKEYNKKWNAEHVEACRKYRKKWRLNNLKKHCEINARYKINNKDKVIARELSRNVIMKDHCEICGSKEKLEKHHWRYDKPKFIATLCTTCHGIQHSKTIK